MSSFWTTVISRFISLVISITTPLALVVPWPKTILPCQSSFHWDSVSEHEWLSCMKNIPKPFAFNHKNTATLLLLLDKPCAFNGYIFSLLNVAVVYYCKKTLQNLQIVSVVNVKRSPLILRTINVNKLQKKSSITIMMTIESWNYMTTVLTTISDWSFWKYLNLQT